jgi:hypothetical protein
MNEYVKRAISYFLSLTIVTIIMIYVLNIPGYLTGANKLIDEYYYKNMVGSFVFDIFICAIYISIAMLVTRFLQIKDNTYELLALMTTCVLISSGFMILFKNGFNKGSFFSRWFAKVGFKGVIYDTILVSTIFVIMKIIHKHI